ncbi:MAG: hypothetical protein HZA46_07615 [Planctomycetales bacterium]|nr:hypothetical protein [Planctomycetales bacterium]
MVLRSVLSWTLALCFAALFLLTAIPVHAGPQIDIVIGKSPPPLERFAVDELADQLRKVYEADVRISSSLADDSPATIFVGNPDTNGHFKPFAAKWPKLSGQGHVLRSVTHRDRPALLVGGGSPAATYWAVTEFGHRLGIRSMLYGDLYPVSPPPLKLDGIDVVMEPVVRLRTWRMLDELPFGTAAWGLDEQRRVLKQLAKLKYNRVILSTHPWQPFVHFKFNGVEKSTGVMWHGWTFPVAGDTAGRAAFGGAKVFDNPDLATATNYDERSAAAHRLLQGIIGSAQELGMSVGLALPAVEFPKEFAAVLPTSKPVPGPSNLTVGPGPDQRPDDPALIALAMAQIHAYLDAYPSLDAVYLTAPHFPEWTDAADDAWKRFAARSGTGGLPSLESLEETAKGNLDPAAKVFAVRALRGNIVALDFYHHLLTDRKWLRRMLHLRQSPIPELQSSPTHRDPNDPLDTEVNLVHVDPVLVPHLEKLLPKRTGVLHFIDHTARRVAAHGDLLAAISARPVPNTLLLTLADNNYEIVPQASHLSLNHLVDAVRQPGWVGFTVRYRSIGDLDLTAYLLSRGSFDPKVTPQSALVDLVTPVCGEGISDRVAKAFELIEQATTLIDVNDLGFSFPIPGVILKHYDSDQPVPEWWGKVRDCYLNAMNEMYRANTRAREGGRSYTLYLARRFEFGFEYMNCVEAVRKAGLAKRKGDTETQLAELEKAIESLHGGLNAMAAVARSNSDRGLIAVLNEFGYRPLKRELEAAEKSAQK